MTALNTIRWGILGTGNIAAKFASGLTLLKDAKIQAVGSRSTESAQGFASRFGIPNTHSSYEALANDPEVDVVYVSSPNTFHKAHTLLCLSAGKAVLCEKPFAINAAEAREMVQLARGRGVFLMEALWTRCFPLVMKLRQWVNDGIIGEVKLLQADFGFLAQRNLSGRLFNPELAGGCLLDVGIYPVSFAFMIFGKPRVISSQAHVGETGVDEQASILFGYEGGKHALLSCSFLTYTAQEAYLFGTRGFIKLHTHWQRPTKMTLSIQGRDDEEFEDPVPEQGRGLHFEAMEVMRCLRLGKTESDLIPLDESMAIMETLDSLRHSWGVKYPMEK